MLPEMIMLSSLSPKMAHLTQHSHFLHKPQLLWRP
jgi:hypothetical protein